MEDLSSPDLVAAAALKAFLDENDDRLAELTELAADMADVAESDLSLRALAACEALLGAA